MPRAAVRFVVQKHVFWWWGKVRVCEGSTTERSVNARGPAGVARVTTRCGRRSLVGIGTRRASNRRVGDEWVRQRGSERYPCASPTADCGPPRTNTLPVRAPRVPPPPPPTHRVHSLAGEEGRTRWWTGTQRRPSRALSVPRSTETPLPPAAGQLHLPRTRRRATERAHELAERAFRLGEVRHRSC